MTIQMIWDLVEGVTAATVSGICIGFWLVLIAKLWKWALGAMKRALLSLFPGLKDLGRKKPEKEKDNGGLVP